MEGGGGAESLNPALQGLNLKSGWSWGLSGLTPWLQVVGFRV